MRNDKRKRRAWNEDEIEGNSQRIKEQVKDKAGEISANPGFEAEGEQERVDGRAQEGIRRTRPEDLGGVDNVEDAWKKADG
jgi:uncharacterized protein YjbJ (UPF0337 family)